MGSFSLNLSKGIRRLRTAGTCRAPRRGKRVDTKVSTLLTPTSFYFLVWRRPETGDRFENRGTAVGLPQHVFLRLFAVHRQRTATHTVKSTQARHSSAAQFVSALLQTGSTRINCTKCLIRRCRALQRAKELRNTGMLRLRKLTHMCSRTLSDTANRLRNIRKKKSSVVLLFSKLSPVSGLRQAIK